MLPVAKIGDVKYATLADAIAAATAGQTIEFIANITEDVTINKSVTIEGANFNYTGTMSANNNITVNVQKVNFVNAGFDKSSKSTNGNYNFYNCTFDGQGTYAYSIKVKGAGKINIKDCTAKNYLYGFLYVSNAVNYGVNVNNVVVEDCSNYAVFFNSGAGASTVLENLTVKNSNAGVVYNNGTSSRTFTMKNCTMEGVNIAVNSTTNGTYTVKCKLEGNENDFGGATLGTNAKVELVDVNSTLAAEKADLNVVSGDNDYVVAYEGGIYKLVPASVWNKTQDIKYATLQAAVNAAVSGDEVVMLKDIEMNDNIKKMYGDEALLIFIMPPSVEELRKRLTLRGQEPEEEVEQRVAKAAAEMTFAPQFDAVIINDDLEKAKAEALEVVNKFLNK